MLLIGIFLQHWLSQHSNDFAAAINKSDKRQQIKAGQEQHTQE